MLMYTWNAHGTGRASGVHDDQKRAKASAAAALLVDPAAGAALVTAVWPPATLFGRYYPAGRTWTARCDGGRVSWTSARTYPQERAA